MKTITVLTQKGGTGKTTASLLLAQAYARQGKNVLCIDLDPQANLTYSLGSEGGMYSIFNPDKGRILVKIGIQSNIDLMPACRDLAVLKTTAGSSNRLKEALKRFNEAYDICIIDTPPQFGELQLNALMASDTVLIPLRADIYSVQGYYQTLNTINSVQRANKNLKISGVIINAYEGRSNIEKLLYNEIINNLNLSNIQHLGTIKKCVAIQEMQTLKKSIYEVAPKNSCISVIESIIERI